MRTADAYEIPLVPKSFHIFLEESERVLIERQQVLDLPLQLDDIRSETKKTLDDVWVLNTGS